jgi:sulfur-oxidizing protein SoxA
MILTLLLGVGPAAVAGELKSGYEFLTQTSRDMQDDEFANPGMNAVDKGRKLFNEKGVNEKTCADCHGEDGEKFDPKSLARYPVYSAEYDKPITLQEQINMCWEDQLDNVPYVYECTDLVALETFVRHQARGETVNVDINGPLRKHYEAGKQLYFTRVGQLGMSCAHCHVYNQGRKLRGQTLSQGQTNGFPEYRLGSGRVTGIHGRVQECFSSFRAEPYDSGSPELIDLEVYLNAKGNGLKIETPAVRY